MRLKLFYIQQHCLLNKRICGLMRMYPKEDYHFQKNLF